MLNVIFGYGNSYTDAVLEAVKTYNNVDGLKTFHAKDVHPVSVEQPNAPMYLCEIWFTLRTPVAEEPKHDYVGSTGIDPSDPEWRIKWDALNAQAATAFSETIKDESGTY